MRINSGGAEQTESETEPDVEEDDIPEATGARLCHWSQTADQETNNWVLTVRASTTSRSQEAALVKGTPAARVCITPSRAYTPPVLPSSSTARHLSPLATHSTATSGVRSSSPASISSTPDFKDIWPGTQSRRNTARGVEAPVVTRAKALTLCYTLFVDPLPGPLTLTSEVHGTWLKALDYIADAGNTSAKTTLHFGSRTPVSGQDASHPWVLCTVAVLAFFAYHVFLLVPPEGPFSTPKGHVCWSRHIPSHHRLPPYPCVSGVRRTATKLSTLGADLATPPLPAAWICPLASQKASFVVCPPTAIL